MIPFRIGHGFDVHAFGGEGPITLGGVKIDYPQGLLAHSDGDVVLHAVADALLGAVALGDIGHHFPDTDAAFKGIDSRILLRKVFSDVKALGYQIGNLDVTIMAQAPKIAPHINAMREVLAADLTTNLMQVNVKATTTEKLGFVGRKEGIAVEAVVLLVQPDA
jgi:2-C-methyl-D-erythritol 2,4-cyclodiphosphate synthase